MWHGSAAAEEFQTALKRFFDKETLLFFSSSETGSLGVSNQAPSAVKNNHIYIQKKINVPVNNENYRDILLYGVLFSQPLLQLSNTVEKISVPLLTNKQNHHDWPSLMSEDLIRNVESVHSKTSIVQGWALGKIVLPIPTSADWIAHSYSQFEMDGSYGRALGHAIETHIINWSCLIQDVLKTDSPELLSFNPGPKAELEFWSSRMNNLESIYHQLQSPIVEKMVKTLEILESSYHPAVKTLTDSVSKGKEVCNLFIKQGSAYLSDDLLLSEDLEESLHMVRGVMKVFSCFKKNYLSQRERLANQVQHTPWNFPFGMIFSRFNQFSNRLLQLENMLEIFLEYRNMEKLEFGGITGSHYSDCVAKMYKDFSNYCHELTHSTNNPLDINSQVFENQYTEFKKMVADMECRLSSELCLAFQDCTSLESALKLGMMIGSFLERSEIRQKCKPIFSQLQRYFREELENCKCLFESFQNQKKSSPIKNMAHTSGALKWIKMLRQRIQMPWEYLRRHLVSLEEEMGKEYHLYLEMISLLKQHEEDIYSDWCNGLEETYLIHLSKPLILRNSSTGLILVNFNKKLTEVVKDVEYIQAHGYINIPAAAVTFYEKRDMFTEYSRSLQVLVECYNTLKLTVLKVELPLIKEELEAIDSQLTKAETSLTWEDQDSWDLIRNTKDLVLDLSSRVSHAKEN
ncbi:hypothetical protein OJAV_G00158270 [Oryzias javanicus]|uniref:Dynein heavy chain tail domain-containing protein n=1 Tax=Oryzias javanicus TaxID=123683 RepID=A0A3S2LWA8_ORYJA|nr:hypothetical protein OJAV_G00158270 [Oryzias javanicus]